MAHPLFRCEWARAFLAHWPADCPLCGSRVRGASLCAACIGQVRRSLETGGVRCRRCALVLDPDGVCHDCSALSPCFEQVVIAFDYAFPGALLIHQLKRQRRLLVAKTAALMLATQVRTSTMDLASDTILLPLPASRASILERGFSPAAEIARHLSGLLGLPVRNNALFRCHESAPQKSLGRQQRMKGSEGLYGCRLNLQGRAVAIVDDVMTTGATLNGAAQAAWQAGARSVCGLVLARTPLRDR